MLRRQDSVGIAHRPEGMDRQTNPQGSLLDSGLGKDMTPYCGWVVTVEIDVRL